MLLRKIMSKKKVTGAAVPVYLNVYDVTTMNGYAHWIGLGVYHSGVEVYGVEYAFGSLESSKTGVSEVEPKHCPGFVFRKSILMGITGMGSKDLSNFMEKISQEYAGNSYDLFTRNCNHFSNDVCIRLIGQPIPRWVNRLARLGVLCDRVLSARLNDKKVKQVKLKVEDKEIRKLTNCSNIRHTTTSIPSKVLVGSAMKNPSSSSSCKKSSKKDRCLPTPSWLTLPVSRSAQDKW